MDPTLNNVLEQTSLKWIFVGGKGGVGKTTTSCSLGVQLAKCRKSVLIVSTDPAHNLSDAFSQKFTRKPTLVEGFSNLYCMELDASAQIEEDSSLATADADSEAPGGLGAGMMSSFMKEFTKVIPGIDEAMSFMELMNEMKRMEFEVTVFDTAPTGHTLRLLALPGTLDRALLKLVGLRDRFGGMLGAVQNMLGAGGAGMPPADELFRKIDETRLQVEAVQKRLRDAKETTFVCVCIPEFLALYETERLVQELTRYEIDTHNVVVNQVLFVEEDATCVRCRARKRMQQQYLDQIGLLYDELFNVVKTPLLNEEVRGARKLLAFGSFLTEPYRVGAELPPELVSAPLDAGGAVGGAGRAAAHGP